MDTLYSPDILCRFICQDLMVNLREFVLVRVREGMHLMFKYPCSVSVSLAVSIPVSFPISSLGESIHTTAILFGPTTIGGWPCREEQQGLANYKAEENQWLSNYKAEERLWLANYKVEEKQRLANYKVEEKTTISQLQRRPKTTISSLQGRT